MLKGRKGRRSSRAKPGRSKSKSGSGSFNRSRGSRGRSKPASTRSGTSRSSRTSGRSPLRELASRRAAGKSSASQAGRKSTVASRTTRRPVTAVRGGTSGASASSEPPLRRRARTTAGRRTSGRRSRSAGTVSAGSAAGTAAANLQSQIDQLRNRFSRIQARAELSDLAQEVGQMDARLSDLPRELEALRSRGYRHAGLLEGEIQSLEEQWQHVQPRVITKLDTERKRLRRELATASRYVNSLSTRNASALSTATAAVNNLQSQTDGAWSAIKGLYSGLPGQVNQLEQVLGSVDGMLERFHRSPGVQLRETEGPLLASEAEWERSGDEGPDGFLFLTDQRLLFEQNEEIVEEKLFGLFATNKETVTELLLDVPVHMIEKMDHSEEGGFLGLGKAEKLNLILGSRAPVSRATFEIKDLDAQEWVVWIKRVKSGEIDQDRAEDYTAEVEAARARRASFPTVCPNCFAPLPVPARGAEYVRCNYCNTLVAPDDGPGEPASEEG